MTDVHVKGRDGGENVLDAIDGTALMETLRDAGLGVDGTCGGACSCGTCHVYISAAWAERLPAKSEDEAAMLEAIGDFVTLQPGSRLSCQIRVEGALSGLTLEIAPPAE